MKVYLVHNEYYDHNEYTCGSILLGIYSSAESAIAARNKFVELELEEASGMNCPAQASFDADNNPVVTKFSKGEPIEDCTFTIEEWDVK